MSKPNIISSLRGGLNEDPPISIANDQCTVANNVEWVVSPLGERRRGSVAIDLTGSDLVNADRIVWAFRHLPTTDPKDAQLWLLGIDDSASPKTILAYKDTSWHTVSISDAATVDGVSEYQWQGQTLHGKLFIAYNSAVDRLHVWDGTSLRRTGLAEPAAPTGANTGSGTLAATARYYRVRYTVKSGDDTLRRSEPSDVLTFTPSGSGTHVRITKPASISESETHWELELSADNANFYRIATTAVGTPTYDDNASLVTLAQNYTLSEDIGDYSLIGSAKFLSADEDRLLSGGSWEDTDLASQVAWTPTYGASGVGNDERLESDTDPSLNLDNYEGGELTGLSAAVNGYVYATKLSHTYQLNRSGVRTRAYEAFPLTKERGALPGSLVAALNNNGNPTMFMLDPDIGPCRIGSQGVEPCGMDLITTWDTVNLDATKVVSRSVYFREHRQIHWWVATGSSNVPDTRLVLHTNEMRGTDDGARRGWAKWPGPSAAALTVCMFSDNIDDDTDRSGVLVPFIGVEGDGLIWRTDTGSDDNGTAYSARIVTKPLVHGTLLDQFEVQNGVLMGKAVTDAVLDVTITGWRADAAQIEDTVSDVDFTAAAGEGDRAVRSFDDLSMAELNALQVEFADTATPGERWELDIFAYKFTGGQQS